MKKEEDIAIVGISVFCPAGEGPEEVWAGLARGGDFITDAPPGIIEPFYFEGKPNGLDRFYCRRGGFAKPFKVAPLRYGILPIIADGLEPDQLSSMAGAEMALIDAGAFAKNISLQKGCIIIGKGNFSGLIALRSLEILRVSKQVAAVLKAALPKLTEDDLERVIREYQQLQGRYQPDMVIGTMPNLVASLVANRFDLHGPAYTIDAACASGIVAINHSIALLRSGQCDIAIAGGLHSTQSAMFWGAFDLMGALSHRGEIAPFSENADGLLIGQGGGFVVLKRLRTAIEHGDRIYAVIKATSVCSDGGGSHVTVTSVKGQVRTLEQAWRQAGMDPRQVGYVEAHGTATPVGDRTEIATLKEFFGDASQPPALVGSVKSNIGHTMPAAGMIGVIKTALALHHRKIPPTLHCERPQAAMFETRFRPAQTLIDWDGEQYPLVAGVNAFGFGGINSHAILLAHEPETPAERFSSRPKPYYGEAIMVSAPDKAALIAKLKSGNYTHTGGDYRLVLFDPDEKRIQQAIAIVEKDKPWRGRVNIWFSNHPMLSNGGKIVYMLPGYATEVDAETDSVGDALGFPHLDEVLPEASHGESGISRAAHRIFCVAMTGKAGLDRLGVEADLYIGHSVGEWHAALFAGSMEGDLDDLNDLLSQTNAFTLLEGLREYPLVAVSGVDCATAENWCARIPGLHMSNDNCPSQVLLCGEQSALDALLVLLKEEKIIHSVLPYGSGFHTPLIKDEFSLDEGFFDKINIGEGHAPVWSAATLEPIPTDKKAYKQLALSQMTRPVYFRGLIEKLHAQENARVFIQIGPGSLVSFVEDTLKDKDFGAIATTVAGRDGADQLRRVLALLFVEGREVVAKEREVDLIFMGIKPIYRSQRDIMTLPLGAPPIIRDFPVVQEVVRARYGAVGPGGDDAFSEAGDPGEYPVLRAAGDNMREAMKVQSELVDLFRKMPPARQTGTPQAVPAPAARKDTPPERAGSGFEETIRLTYEAHPYLRDHSIVRQPENWPFAEDLNPVVPFTMTIELLAEMAKKHAPPGKKLLKLAKVAAYQWIEIAHPFEASIKGTWKQPDVLELQIGGHAKAEAHFGEQWQVPPAEYAGEIDVGAEIMKPVPVPILYEKYSFHGPAYHSNTELLKVSERGMINLTEKRDGKGSLLDIMGQQLGLFLHLTQTRNTISFPVRLNEIAFFEDFQDQGGVFEHTMIVTRMTENLVTGNMVLKRNGKIWSVARDFVCQRFENYLPVWQVIITPRYHLLAENLAPGVFFYSNNDHQNVLLLLVKRYLNSEEKKTGLALESDRKKREYLISRIALKDAVRERAQWKENGRTTYLHPVEISHGHDENGKPVIFGYGDAARRVDGICVSLSHKDSGAIAIASDRPVGIDLEKIEEKPEGFLKEVFTEKERELLCVMNRTEGAIRFWVAKEACAKKTGLGFQGSPKKYEVRAVDGDVIVIGDERVKTIKIGEDYIAGWTT
ncbi:MAG: 4'-phosphopantetheinyl transferase superfamily protein [Azoarcus sp.]|jgi:3-oxoacyl-(acyl-carrier-protein) synthase/malonyl CoA-acyl carrier protein transacylase/phosphopantetheinyl transferase|nr:4'-phosphopantetheinyl transferase superfamily protein [Azoarcus sp.]